MCNLKPIKIALSLYYNRQAWKAGRQAAMPSFPSIIFMSYNPPERPLIKDIRFLSTVSNSKKKLLNIQRRFVAFVADVMFYIIYGRNKRLRLFLSVYLLKHVLVQVFDRFIMYFCWHFISLSRIVDFVILL